MKSSSDSNQKNILDAAKALGTIVTYLGGTAALFIAFGYITILSCLSSLRLYGLFDYSNQFYKEVIISFIRDISSFYSGHPILTIFAFLIASSTLLLPYYFKKPDKATLFRFIPSIIIAFICIFVTFLTITLDYFEKIIPNFSSSFLSGVDRKFLLFFISLPVLIAIFIFLVTNYESIKKRDPQKTYVLAYLIIFIALFISIPIGYGTYLYTPPAFAIEPPELVDGASLVEFENEQLAGNKKPGITDLNSKYDYLYILGQVPDKEIYVSLKIHEKIRILIIDKTLIKASKVNYTMESDLRRLLDLARSPEQDKFDIEFVKIK